MTVATIGLRCAAAALMLALAAPCAAAHANEGEVIELPGEGPYQRFIVKFREDSAPGRDPQTVQARLDRAAAATVLPGDAAVPALTWERRMGVQADVLRAARPLQREEARSLLQQLAADPDVEYVEVDAMMGIGPIRGD